MKLIRYFIQGLKIPEPVSKSEGALNLKSKVASGTKRINGACDFRPIITTSVNLNCVFVITHFLHFTGRKMGKKRTSYTEYLIAQ